jgi:hypothetical protein
MRVVPTHILGLASDWKLARGTAAAYVSQDWITNGKKFSQPDKRGQFWLFSDNRIYVTSVTDTLIRVRYNKSLPFVVSPSEVR